MFEDPQSAELFRFRAPSHPCAYLPGETTQLDYRLVAEVRVDDYSELLRRGWRRFGGQLFRPACPRCAECKSLRVLAQDFRPSRSQRRNRRANAGVRVIAQRPSVTREHVELYNAYHADMQQRKGWPPQVISANEYAQTFLGGDTGFARELVFVDDDRVVAVGLVDVLDDALSSVYFFHDPSLRSRALGVFSVLEQLRFCREAGLRYLYLGYWIAGCASMSYKDQYRPHETLVGYPDDREEPHWVAGSDR